MNDLDAALFEAWDRVGPRLVEDPEELKRRLARRRNKEFVRPLRASCIAVRASDLRIDDNYATIHPRHAMSMETDAHPGRYAEHRVELSKELLERICKPVEIARPGEPADEVARRLGCAPHDLRTSRQNGFFSTNRIRGLRGRRGRPVPLIYTQQPLDPQSVGREMDPIFAFTWRHNVESLPEGFRFWLTRRPCYQRRGGGEWFTGWRWVCPRCGRIVRTVYYPVDEMDFPTWIGFAPAKSEPMPKPKAGFACMKCHGVAGFSRACLARDWNKLILRYSGGLMYGHEVKKPDWLKPGRKRPQYQPRQTPRAAPRRDQIERLLVETDLSYCRLGAQLGISYSSVATKALRIFQRHNVGNRAELKAKLRPRRLAAAG